MFYYRTARSDFDHCLLIFVLQRTERCRHVYDNFPASSYVAYGEDAIGNEVISYKWLPVRTMVAAVYFQLGMLLAQTVQQDCHVTYVGTQKQGKRHVWACVRQWPVHTCAHIHLHTYMHAHSLIHAHTYMYTCKHARTQTHSAPISYRMVATRKQWAVKYKRPKK